jgi:hypothetical protein
VARDEYTWDVFVSFRRYRGFIPWLEETFLPTLSSWLAFELPGPPPRIFYDASELESQDWPMGLAKNHSESAVLVALWSLNYRESLWCSSEFDLMETREQQTGFTSASQPRGLIIPALVHDGDNLPVSMRRRNAPDLWPYVNGHLVPKGDKAQEFEEKIKRWAPVVAKAILAAPDPDPAWIDAAAARMNQAFEAAPARQTTVPGRGF